MRFPAELKVECDSEISGLRDRRDCCAKELQIWLAFGRPSFGESDDLTLGRVHLDFPDLAPFLDECKMVLECVFNVSGILVCTQNSCVICIQGSERVGASWYVIDV